jgi:nicotinamide phosphoribosyltransferase
MIGNPPQPVDVYKQPVTDSGKKSKAGRLRLVLSESGEYRTEEKQPVDATGLPDELVTVFENGELVKDWTLEEIRSRANRDPLFN